MRNNINFRKMSLILDFLNFSSQLHSIHFITVSPLVGKSEKIFFWNIFFILELFVEIIIYMKNGINFPFFIFFPRAHYSWNDNYWNETTFSSPGVKKNAIGYFVAHAAWIQD